MKTLTCREPNKFLLEDQPIPSPKAGEALIKIKKVGICGTDIHAFHGNQPFFTYPRVLGHELSGEVVELNGQTDSINVGDRVTVLPYLECNDCIACRNNKPNCCTSLQVLGVHTDGGMKEYMTVPVSHLIGVNSISFEEACLVEPLSIGAHAVRRSGLKKGQTALVIGAGPIGLAVMRFAKLTGATVIGMDINEERLDFCQEWSGADHVVNALKAPIDEIKNITNGDFPTVVLDATGNQASMNQAIQFVAHGGTLVYVGLIKGDIAFASPEFHKRELSLLGSRNATLEDFNYVINCMEKGLIKTKALISRQANLNDLVENFTAITDPKNNIIKAIVALD